MPAAHGATVALDGFGAEQGFEALAEGARAAAADGIRLRVFGPPERLGLDGVDGHRGGADRGVDRQRGGPGAGRPLAPEASVVRAAADVAEGRADALVSHGSTGATMAAATFGLRRLQGVQRPALAVQLPVPGKPGPLPRRRRQRRGPRPAPGPVRLPGRRLQRGGARRRRAPGRPALGRRGGGQGREEVVAAHATLSEAPGIDFVGNVEGRDLPAGAADVVVTDGFTGNVALKLMEGTARTVTAAIRDAARSNPIAAAGGLLMRPALGGLRRELHPDTTGGAILLGLRGIAVVGHGSSGAEGIANAVRLAARGVEVDAVGRTRALRERAPGAGRWRCRRPPRRTA